MYPGANLSLQVATDDRENTAKEVYVCVSIKIWKYSSQVVPCLSSHETMVLSFPFAKLQSSYFRQRTKRFNFIRFLSLSPLPLSLSLSLNLFLFLFPFLPTSPFRHLSLSPSLRLPVPVVFTLVRMFFFFNFPLNWLGTTHHIIHTFYVRNRGHRG